MATKNPYYDILPGVNEDFLFPDEIINALIASDQFVEFKKALNEYADTVGANVIKKLSLYGPENPTAPEDRTPGRIFYNTTIQAAVIWNGSSWQSLGGPVEIPWADFATLGGNYQLPDASEKNVPLVLRTGKRIDVYATIWRKRSLPNGFIHGEVLFTAKPAFKPARNGSVPFSCVESGGSASASAVGGGFSPAGGGSFVLWSPKDPNIRAQNLDISGTYYTV